MGAAAQLSTALYRQYRWLDDCRAWPPTLAHLRPDAHERRILKHRLGEQRTLHVAWIHGSIYGTRPALHGPHLSRDQHWPRTKGNRGPSDSRRLTLTFWALRES